MDPAVLYCVEREVAGHKAQKKQAEARLKQLSKEYNELLGEIAAYREFMDSGGHFDGHAVKPGRRTGKRALTAVAQASDWHAEERVDPAKVNGLNAYNLSVYRRRKDAFFRNLAKLINRQREHVEHVVLHMGGDFITGSIHDENRENCAMPPVAAATLVAQDIIGGIEYLLANTETSFTLVWSVGNHSRMTKQAFFQTEVENSLESFMAFAAALRFDANDRVATLAPSAYHTYVKIYDVTCRFHHGHRVSYGGGVGGLTIPMNKAIAQWNKARWADLDFFGHFHQQMALPNFRANGSLIGWSPYAIGIKASYEPPQQLFSVIDSKYGPTITAPIIVEERK